MSSRIEQLIEEIEEFVDKCKYQPLSSTKIIVNKEELDEYLRELRLRTPEEIKRYQKIIANKDAILADAQSKADAMIEEASIHTNEMVSDHEIMQRAYSQADDIVKAATAQAQEILNNAAAEANEMRSGAVKYSAGLLANIEDFIAHALDNYTSRYDELVSSLRDSYDLVKGNRRELNAENADAASSVTIAGADAKDTAADGLNVVGMDN